jgi:hypothetical protein
MDAAHASPVQYAVMEPDSRPPIAAADCRAKQARLQVPTYKLAAALSMHPTTLGAILNERVPLDPALAGELMAVLDKGEATIMLETSRLSLIEKACAVVDVDPDAVESYRKLGETRVRLALWDGRVFTFETAALRAWTPGSPPIPGVARDEPRPDR